MTTISPTAPIDAAEGIAPVPRPEYPRPHFDRSERWLTLNGTWDFLRDAGHSAMPPHDGSEPGHGSRPGHDQPDGDNRPDDAAWPERILVPFAWETPASGVGAHWLDRAWYRRTFTVPAEWRGERTILHFGAVHHETAVWVDGSPVGSHVGGYVPFEFDITGALSGTGEHTLLVRVDAPIDKRSIPHGKQRSVPRDDYDGCSFTPTSGIWQPVWLEPRPATHLASLSLAPTAELDGIVVRGDVAGADAVEATVRIELDGEPVLTTDAAALSAGVVLPVSDPVLWEPERPRLYEVAVSIDSPAGRDRVRSTTGLRRIETRGSQLYLNGTRISLRGVLDQGYWPRTGSTAPDDAAFVTDLLLAREAGFTLVRKHLKLEDPRFLFHADRLGMLVWAEPASTGRFSEAGAAAFAGQIAPMVQRDGNHPSIVVWGLYNEEWGLDWDLPSDPAKQRAVRDAVQQLKALDRTRPVVDNSGWTHLESDLIDWHVYDEQPAGWARKVAALVDADAPAFPVAIAVDAVVEKSLMVEGSVPRDVPFLNSEFGGGYTSLERGWNLHWQTQELRRHDAIAGYVWTELTDIEHETAGIFDAERIMKDHGGRVPGVANAETVTVFDVTPIWPGLDLAAPGGEVSFSVAVSHHGGEPVELSVGVGWGPALGEELPASRATAGTVLVEPFRLSAPVDVTATMPTDTAQSRLHVVLTDPSGRIRGRGALDVVRS